jgi:hypothetical protein
MPRKRQLPAGALDGLAAIEQQDRLDMPTNGDF